MGKLTLRVLGSGDAFGSGGRFQTCLSVEHDGRTILVDCGTSSLIAMKRFQVDPASVEAVIVSHLHGDHMGGIPFLVLDGQFSHRERPLIIAGPPTMKQRLLTAMEVLFPGSSLAKRRFQLEFVELEERAETPVADAVVTAYPVIHASGAPASALRLSRNGRVVTYSGDTQWTDVLLEASAGADLFICESYSLHTRVRYHLSYDELRANRERLTWRRLLLTHLSPEILGNQDELSDELAHDGLIVEL